MAKMYKVVHGEAKFVFHAESMAQVKKYMFERVYPITFSTATPKDVFECAKRPGGVMDLVEYYGEEDEPEGAPAHVE